jgi:hypothetical protein
MAQAQTESPLPKMFAHRGCWSKIVPENSIPAVGRAARHGYMGIELDVKMTKDGKMVIMHDKWLNRTCRHASDYSKLTEKVSPGDLTFKELRENYVLASPKAEYRTPIPTLEEILKECKKHKIVPMLHSKYVESYRLAQKIMGNNWICFTNNIEGMKECRTFSKCLILYGIRPNDADNAFELLPQLGGKVGGQRGDVELVTDDLGHDLVLRGGDVEIIGIGRDFIGVFLHQMHHTDTGGTFDGPDIDGYGFCGRGGFGDDRAADSRHREQTHRQRGADDFFEHKNSSF